MSSKYLLGLDAGGGGGRCLLVNSETGEAVTTFRAWSHPPAPVAGGFAYDLDTTNLWRTLGKIVSEALAKARIAPADIAGIAATSMRHGLVVIDRQGNALLATPNKDARAVDQSMRLGMESGADYYQRCGHYPSPVFIAPRLLWLKENVPEAFNAAWAALSISDWVGYLLTGEIAAEPSQAAESMLLDLHTRAWAGDLMRTLGLSERLLPPLKNAGSHLGKLTEQAAAHLGLAAGIPVAVGGADTQCGLLGSGVISAGQVGVIAGTTTPVQMATAQPTLDSQMRTWSGLHVIPGLYVLESNAGTMGSTLEWIAQMLYAGNRSPAAALCAQAEGSPPGASGIVSTIGAAVFNAGAMGLPVDNLTFSSTSARAGAEARSDLARAVLEGMAYAVRANVEQVLEVSGLKIKDLYLGGGMSRSATWTRILSEVTGCRVHVSALAEASALGAAICAAVGAGLYPDLASGARVLSRIGRQHTPDEAVSRRYQGLYKDWQSLRLERIPADDLAASQLLEALPALQTSQAGNGPAPFRPRIYITAEVDEAALEALRALGEVTYASYRQEGRLLVGDELVETLAGYHVFVTEVDIVSAEDLLNLPDLRLVAVCRGNPVNVDINACSAAGVLVVNTPARNSDAVADLAVGFILMLARRLQGATAFLHEPGSEASDLGRMGMAHEQFHGTELWRKTIGVVGGGAIGRKVIQRLLPYETRMLLYDPYISAEQAVLMGAEKVPFDQLLAESDFLTLHAPVTDETRGMINAEAFRQMKPGAFLVNTARAALVDPQALLAALRSGKLGGAAFDVFPVEPPGADDPLLAFPNVIATPHIGGNTNEVAAHQGEIVASELRLLLAGKKPDFILNPATWDTFRWTGKRESSERELLQLASAPGPGATDLDLEAQRKKQATQPKTETPTDGEKKGGLLSAFKKVLGGKAVEMTTTTTSNGSSMRTKMLQILEEFLAKIAADRDLAAFSQGKNVVMHFTLKDMDQTFYMAFVDGKVETGLGNPPREPDVRLKMSADTLDGMFTGRVNATRAAMSGKLSFSGDTGKAMSFQRIQRDLSRLYSESRQKMGDPGDLLHIADDLLHIAGDLTQIGSAVPAAPPQAASAAAEVKIAYQPGPSAAARVRDIRDMILEVTKELYAKGLITPTGGNISARTDDNPDHIWITPSAIFKGDLRPELMVRIDLDGSVINETSYSASSERRVHCSIYRARPDVMAVVHTHAPYATLMALTGTKFLPISTEAAFLGDVPVVPFIMPGTNELGDEVAKAMGAGFTALMQNHGLVVAGSSLRRAADMTDVVEVTAQKLITCRMMGVTPPLLPDEVVATLREVGNMMA